MSTPLAPSVLPGSNMAIRQLITRHEATLGYAASPLSDTDYARHMETTAERFDQLVYGREIVFDGGSFRVFRAIPIGLHMVMGTPQAMVAQPQSKILRGRRGAIQRRLGLYVPHDPAQVTAPVWFKAQNSHCIGGLALSSANQTPTDRSKAKLLQFQELLEEVVALSADTS